LIQYFDYVKPLKSDNEGRETNNGLRNPPNDPEDDTCDAWDCIWKSTIKGALGGVIKYVSDELVSGSKSEIGTSIISGAVAGFIYGVLNGDGCCVRCYKPQNVTLYFVDCEPRAWYTASGFGGDAIHLYWDNGTTGIPQSAITPASNPRLLIRQVQNNIRVETFIWTRCKDNSERGTGRFEENLFYKVNTATLDGKTISGPRVIYPGTEADYVLVDLSSGNYVVEDWYVSQGTIVQNYGNAARIQWNQTTDHEVIGSVSVRMRHTCSNTVLHQSAQVRIRMDGPVP
jgi:hypothetical protein